MTVTREMPSKSCGIPRVKRSTPETESTPMTVMPMPRTSEAKPFRTLSETTEDVAMKANIASAKNSSGPNIAENSTRLGETKTTRTEETMPPMNAPIAAVARACGARPALAIRCPSNVEAMADAWPGVFSRMAIVESPKRPPK